jgi:GNAT superfamily N-acetyltransferase
VDHPLRDEIAASVRAAYAGSDPRLPLPVADGAREDAGSVAADLSAGAWLCVARDPAGALVGSVRAFARPGGCWEVRRLAVVPAQRGTGLARALVRRLEDAARLAGAGTVRLDAVVERGNPPFYTRLGYATLRHFPNPDKPLSEVDMERSLSTGPVPLRYPWQGERADPGYPLLVTWHATAGGTLARLHRGVARARDAAGAAPGFLGADGWPPPGEADPERVLAGLAAGGGTVHGDAVRFAAPAVAVAAFRMPRLVHPDLLALWRLPAAG